jgi:hypothetical protein
MVKHLLELAAKPFKGSRLSGTRAQRQQPRQRRRRWQQQQQQLQQRSNVMSTHSVITLREEMCHVWLFKATLRPFIS